MSHLKITKNMALQSVTVEIINGDDILQCTVSAGQFSKAVTGTGECITEDIDILSASLKEQMSVG